ncbi:MAG TPA: hypothetical protein PKD61_26220 [Polyangiaceae bacterium]|nr:hypothetical protein [Polyangiaceae bacterium]
MGFRFSSVTVRFTMRVTTCAALCLLSAPGGAAETETISLNYDVVSGCPSRAQFVGEILARTDHAAIADQTQARRLQVNVTREADAFVGVLRISDDKHPPAERSIEGESCQSVVLALAIAAALAIDPDADTRPEATALGAPSTPAPAPNATPRKQAKSATQPSTGTDIPTNARPTNVPRAAKDGAVRVSAGAGLVATWGPAPEVLVTPAPFVGFTWPSDSSLELAIRLQPSFAQTGTLGPAFDAADFRLASLRTEICPASLALASDLALLPCATSDVGVIFAKGRAIAEPASETKFWLALGARGRLVWSLNGWLFVDLAAGLAAAPLRYEYVFRNPKSRIYQPPLFSPNADFSVGGRF